MAGCKRLPLCKVTAKITEVLPKIFRARMVMSSIFPIGVETIYSIPKLSSICDIIIVMALFEKLEHIVLDYADQVPVELF